MTLEEEILSNGFAIVPGIFDTVLFEYFDALLERTADVEHGRGGLRNLLDVPEMRELATSEPIMKLVQSVLGGTAFPVRGILFDKQDGANWKVPWHQDVTIAVTSRIEIEGYGPWSIKSNVLHVQPPSSILENMLSVRLHLDDCPKTNGALRVVLNSHKIRKIEPNGN